MPQVTPYQLNLTQATIGDIYASLEQSLFDMFVDRLTNHGAFPLDEDHMLQWQAEQLNQLHLVNEATIKVVSKATKLAEPKLRQLFKDFGIQIANTEYARLGDETGQTMNPSTNIDQLMDGYLKQTFLDINNNVNQTLITTNYGENAATRTYQQIVKETTAKVITGLKTPARALADTVYEWRDKGIQTVLTDKGTHPWSLEGYARTVITTTSNRAFQAVRDQAADDYDIDTFAMSSHPASREACAPIQGKTITTRYQSFRSKVSGEWFESLYNHGYGQPAGTFGINCHHQKWAYIPGVSKNSFSQFDPDEAIRNGNVQAKQRELERRVRKYKANQQLAEKLGDVKGVEHFNKLIKDNQSALRDLVKGHDFLHRDYSREKSFGPSEKEVKSLKARSTINVEKQNRHIPGTKQYADYVRVRYTKGKKYPPSRLTISIEKAQKLINKYGNISLAKGYDLFDAGEKIGVFIDQNLGDRFDTSLGRIAYSKSGAHITPLDPRKGLK
jgi:hypothetical protein